MELDLCNLMVLQSIFISFCVFLQSIDLEKAYDKVPRNVMWWALEKHKVPTKYIILIKDM